MLGSLLKTKTPKKISGENELSLLRAKIDVLDQQITRAEQVCAVPSR